MGMFDTIRCECRLPVKGVNSLAFQTKSLECGLLDYLITESGTLEELLEDKKPVKFTGEVIFYACEFSDGTKGWIEFAAYFHQGTLQRLNLGEYYKIIEGKRVDLPADNLGDVYTHEETESMFLEHVATMTRYWETLKGDYSVRYRLEGLAFSILSAIDGCASIPPFSIPPFSMSPVQCIQHLEEGEKRFPSPLMGEDAIEIGGVLHERIGQFLDKK